MGICDRIVRRYNASKQGPGAKLREHMTLIAASLALAQHQYRLGAVVYSELLNSEKAYRTAVLNRVIAQAARYSDTAALFQALGGGWWNRTDIDPKSEGKPAVFWLPPVQDIRLPAAGR